MSIMITEQGTPIISRDGNFYNLDEREAFRQRIWNLFNTQVGSSLLFPDYGFDSLSIIRANPADRERALYSYVIDALNPDNVEGLEEVLSLNIKYENNVGYLNMVILSIYGERIETAFEVDTNEF